MGSELPRVPEAAERVDARRNRAAILAAAAELARRDGADGVSMDAVAAAACVGKGTLYRRFGDRAGLMRALLHNEEVEFQERILRGAPPLGPGAPPRTRLVAFGREALAFIDRHAPLLASVTVAPATVRLTSQPLASWRLHLTVLLTQAFADPRAQAQADYAADILISALTGDMFLYQTEVQGCSLAEIQDRWEQLVHRLAPAPG